MKSIIVVALRASALTLLGLVTAFPEVHNSIRDEDYHPKDIIRRDVCVIGGGSGGTYSAIRLRELGQSVVVIEKQALMGGHTNTYSVPGTNLKIDYGVVVFHNTSIVRDYFGHFKIPLAALNFATAGTTTTYVDFRTGDVVAGFVPSNPIAALPAYVQQLERYPFLATGINLPDPVPADLLIPFSDFVQKYSLGNLVQTIENLGQGYADLLSQPTLYALKLLSLDLVQTLETGFIATAQHDNHLLYDAAAAELSTAHSLLLSSHVLHVKRNHDSDGTSKIVVQTPSGKKLVIAKKIVVAIPPKLSNFDGWDLDHQEKNVFSKFRNEAYYTGLLTNTGLPSQFTVTNIGSDTPFNLPALPGLYGLSNTAAPGLIDVKYASTFQQSDQTVKDNILDALGRLKIPGVTTTPKKAQFAAFNAHVPFFEHVTAEEIKAGFYKQANALQGHSQTWYTGAAWEAQDSSMIWSFTETLLPSIVAA